MIVLCGSPISNYYNKVKLALLEKGLAFTEERAKAGSQDEAVLSGSPLGKIPFIRCEHGTLCESQAILEYLDATYPQTPLMPTDTWAAAKVRELTIYIDLHLELVARDLYPKAFFGGEVSEGNAARVRNTLQKNIAGFKRLAKFSPYVAGNQFTQADCAAYVSLPLVSMASRIVFGEDLLAAAGVELKPYVQLVGERASAAKVTADRKAEQERMAARR
ncbi:MAG: glutathione S-transferase [Rhizobacter sp.]|nr:glutathione S-transferase [Rhizobacter sp.]